MRKTLLTLALAALSHAAGAADLTDIYRQARQNDAIYASAQAAYKAGMEKLPQGRALLLPSLNLSANARHVESDTSVTPSKSYNTPSFTLALSQPLFRRQNLETLEQAKLQVQAVEAQLKLAEQDLLLRTAQAYFDVLLARDNLATAEAQKTAIAEQLAQAKKSFEVGAATIVDTHEAQARYDATVAQVIASSNDLDVKNRTLEKLIMAPAPHLASLVEHVVVSLPQPNDMDAWVGQARDNSLSVAVSRAQAEIAQREVSRQRAGYLPTVDLTASYTDTRNTLSTTGLKIDSNSAVVGVELGWNLYQGGATDSLVREAVANKEKASFDLDNAVRQAELDTRQAFLGVVSGEAQVRALEQAVASSETQLKSTKLGQEVGVRTAVDVLNAQQSLYTAKRDLASARYTALISGLKLKAVSGGLAEADLQALNGLLREDR
ncbi:channel protein TolC [Parasulfuritortus cantonensis]|uniref:Channel protein TolC n=1 Tax=Parasulfuritortus cantonensis TaxID=2528202 RepID=A0A4R1B4B5_9PROT|nr:TolC family outer membrane protein [Parasulfuritortus cantonensis]TCJ12934.1 channel protein TolC [Parasulfuritortus cantonensis]